MDLHRIAKDFVSNDPATKSLRCYAEYDGYFARHLPDPRTILEVGVHKGESTKVFSRAFPQAKIVAIDLAAPGIDFSDFPNVTYLQCDQTDTDRLESSSHASVAGRCWPGRLGTDGTDGTHGCDVVLS